MTRLAGYNKFSNRKVEIDGYTFDSKREAARYQELKLLEQAGEIRHLRVHPKIPLYGAAPDVFFHLYGQAKGVYVFDYVPDFTYRTKEQTDSEYSTIEDVKGVLTQGYKLKKKLMKACYGVDILET